VARSEDRADLTAVDRQGNGVLAVVPWAMQRWSQDGGYTKNAGFYRVI